ncbi:hypothetical protein C8J55DRAFT_500349 [Lentinula edodes]|uniref:Uncharacterized protein n=1 Tax=Lentinula lateritia TaxID=40482 RepID=A0A9W9AZ87_9AGAR|nr:hypothetical protein C8J55DRAFT_500349 [Lentinula edodes]
MDVAVKTEAPSSLSKALKVPKTADVVPGNDEVTRIPKKRGRKPKNRATDASEVPKTADIVSGNDTVKPIPKKRGRKPKNSITDKPRRLGKTSGDATASQTAIIQKKGVEVSLDLGKTSKNSEGKKPRDDAKSKLPTSGRPVWKAVPVSPSPMGFANSITPNMNPRPRQWCSSKEELLAILPELGNPKLVGTSPVPVILIEGNEGMSISDSKFSNEDRTVVDLCVERDFVCLVSDLSVSSNSSSSVPMTGIHSSSIPSPQSAENLEELCKGEVKLPREPIQHYSETNMIPLTLQTLPPNENEEPSEDIQPECTHVTRLSNPRTEPDAEKTVSASHDVPGSQSISVNYEEPPVGMISGWSHDKDCAQLPAGITEITPKTLDVEPGLDSEDQTSSKLGEKSIAEALNFAGLNNSVRPPIPKLLPEKRGKLPSIRRDPSSGISDVPLSIEQQKSSIKIINKSVKISSLRDSSGRRKYYASSKNKQHIGPVTRAQTIRADESLLESRNQRSKRVLRPRIKRERSQTQDLPIPITLPHITPTSRVPQKSNIRLTISIPSAHIPRLDDPPYPSIPALAVSDLQNVYASRSPPSPHPIPNLERTESSSLSPLTPLEEDDDYSPVKNWKNVYDMVAEDTMDCSSPLTPLTDDRSPLRDRETYDTCAESKPMGDGQENVHYSSSSSMASCLQGSSPVSGRKSINNTNKQRTLGQKQVDISLIPSPSIPSNEESLPVQGWNNSLYGGSKNVVKSLKFTKKKETLEEPQNGSSTDTIESHSTLSSTKEQMLRKSAVNNRLIAINDLEPLEPGEIRESNAVYDAYTVPPPMQTRWQYFNQALMVQWMALNAYVPNMMASSHNWGLAPSGSELQTPRYLPVHNSSSDFTTSSSASLSASPFSVHTAPTPFTSPASGYSGPTSTAAFSQYSSPSIASRMSLAPTTCEPTLNTSPEPMPSISYPAKLGSEKLDASIRPSRPISPTPVSSFSPTSLSSKVPFPPKAKRGRKRKIPEMEAFNSIPPLKRICVPAEGELIGPATFATRVPTQVPPEIRVLIDAYTQNTPILVIASRDATLAYCGGSITRDLPAEFQYMYMGFFKVLSVEEDRVFRPSSSSVVGILVSSDYAFGRVQWRFELEWISAGEDNLGIPSHLKLSRPWWRDATNWEEPFDVSVTQNLPSEYVLMNHLASFAVTSSSSVTTSTEVPNVNDSESQVSPPFSEQCVGDSNSTFPLESLRPLCPSIIWLALLACNDSVNIGDIGSPKGWYCNSCGKLNRQRFFKRRKCDSSFCKDTLITACNPHRLDVIRSVGQQSPLVFPLNTVPEYIDPLISEWDDGMRTVTYHVWNDRIVERLLDQYEHYIRLAEQTSSTLLPLHPEPVSFSSRAVKLEAIEKSEMEMQNASHSTRESRILQLAQTFGILQIARDIQELAIRRKIVAKHIFTCNDPKLQEEQSQLLDSIQETVILRKKPMATTPFFSYVAGNVHECSFASGFIDAEVTPVSWNDVPPCINQARSLLRHLGAVYGDMFQTTLIRQLVVLGWTVPGRKKAEHLLHAKECNIVIMALGHELGIRIIPKSGFPANVLRAKKINVIEDATSEKLELPVAIEGVPVMNNSLAMAIDAISSTQVDTSSPFPVEDDVNASNVSMESESTPGPQVDVMMTEASSMSMAIVLHGYNEHSNSTQPSALTVPDVNANESSQMIANEDTSGNELMLMETHFDGLIRMEFPEPVATSEQGVYNDCEDDPHALTSSWPEGVTDNTNETEEPSLELSSKSQNAIAKRKTHVREDMHFILVHGDALVLSGDDFEYAIERKGMGLLLVGSM